jgi:hypothetical protein
MLCSRAITMLIWCVAVGIAEACFQFGKRMQIVSFSHTLLLSLRSPLYCALIIARTGWLETRALLMSDRLFIWDENARALCAPCATGAANALWTHSLLFSVCSQSDTTRAALKNASHTYVLANMYLWKSHWAQLYSPLRCGAGICFVWDATAFRTSQMSVSKKYIWILLDVKILQLSC